MNNPETKRTVIPPVQRPADGGGMQRPFRRNHHRISYRGRMLTLYLDGIPSNRR